MLNKTRSFLFCLGAVLGTACHANPRDAVGADHGGRALAKPTEVHVVNGRSPISRRFETLDKYLAHLERQSHMDGKWYKEYRPGVYEVQTGNLHLDDDRQQRIFTREELERKFGFRE